MMPGETPPPAGTAAAACTNCGVLQQNINEYVAALIALKQKMIDGDRLLTEYQQKCTELQFAEREISALRCQVEQMLQKILPLEKCQEELGSLKAELEEKKSSLKIYQESQLEYVKIKEEIVNSDALRKKLETKVKKLEEAATKHTQDFRQLKTEKKRLEKELKKAQGKLDVVLKEKCRQVKHAETQSSATDVTTDIDKEKVKLLLEELWMCIDSATGKRENQKNDPVMASVQDKAWPEKRRLTLTEETVQIHQKVRKRDGKTLPWYSSLESAGKQNSVTTMQLQVSTEPFGDDCVENRTTEECLYGGEDKTVDVIIQTDGAHSNSDFSDQELKGPGGSVMDILNWARPLPALLSPVQLSPLSTQDTLFGEVTGSSDEEVDWSASAVEVILQERQVQHQSCNAFSLNEECNRQSKSCEHGLDAEISCNLSWNEKKVLIGPKMSSKEERDAEAKQAEATTLITNMETDKDCLEKSENMETKKRELTEATVHELEAVEEKKRESEDMHSEEGGSSADSVLHSFKPQNQMEKCSEVEQTEENVILIRAANYEGTHEKHGELMKAESNGLSERETPRAVSVSPNATHLPPEQCILLQGEDSEEKSDLLIQNEVVENESKNVVKVTNTASDVGENINQVIIGKEIKAAIQVEGLCAEAGNKRELSENVLSDFRSSKSFCEVESLKDLMTQYDGEGIIMKTEADTGAIEISARSQCSEIKHDSEEILEKQYVQTIKDEVDSECEAETVKVSRHYLTVSAIEGVRNSLSMDDVDKNVGVERTALSAFRKDDEQLKIEDMNVTRPESIDLVMKFNRESVLEISESSELLHSAENRKLVHRKEGGHLKGKPHQEENNNNLSQGKSDLECILALPKMTCIIDAESGVAKCESSVLDFTEIKGEMEQPQNLCSTLECQLSKTQKFRGFESKETELKVNLEAFGDESSDVLERVDMTESVLAESNLTSQAQFAKPLNQFLVTENVKCDEVKGELNKQSKELVAETYSSSLKWEENVVKKNNISEIICQPTSEMVFNSGLTFSTQGDLEMVCINTEETDASVQVGISLESTIPPDLNCSLQKVVGFVETDFREEAAFSHTWENEREKKCVVGSALNCSSGSLEEGAEVLSAEKDNVCKELDCREREYVHKNEVKIPDEKEQPVDKEPQPSVTSQILDANSYNKSTFLQKFDCQESGCRTSMWEVRTDPSMTGSLITGGESKELTSFEASGKNTIKRSKNDFDMPEQSNESEEKACSVQKVRNVKCSECVPMFRKELRTSRTIAVGALETGAIADSDYHICELHSTVHPGNTSTLGHLKADTVVDIDTHCETNTFPDTANELSSVVGEGYSKDSLSCKTECVLIASENTEGANKCIVDSNRAGCFNDSEESLLKTGTSKESLVMPNASKNRLPLCQMSTRFSETCRPTVKTSKLNTRMLALGNFLEENDSEKLQSNVEQSVYMGASVFEEYNSNSKTCTACNVGENNTDVILDSNSRKKKKVKYLPNPALSDVECNCQSDGQPSEPQKTVFEKLSMLESESCEDVALKKSNKLECKEQEPSEILTASTKTAAQVMHAKLSKRLFQDKRKTKTPKVKLTQPVLANADTSMPTKCSSETINKIRQEMGPPLPPLLLPLVATPPKDACTVSPVLSSTGRSSLLSPLDDLISPLRDTPVPPLMSPLTNTPTAKSALLFSPPSSSEMAVGRRICSSPLKFCTSIPKHALPVPGRFPMFAADSVAPGAPPENSVKILDTMYPELSARARTLNILKGNIQLNRCAFPDSQSLPGPVAQIGGFKAIASTSTAFVKTGSNLKSDSSKNQGKDAQNQQLLSSSSNHLEERTLLPISMPRSAKRLRLDSEPPKLEPSDIAAMGNTKNTISEMQEAFHDKSCEIGDSGHSSSLEASLSVKTVIDPGCQKVSLALKKIAESCFDLLPVIKGHVYVSNISKIPIMRDEEKEVIYEFGVKNKFLDVIKFFTEVAAKFSGHLCQQLPNLHLAESLLHAILNKLKAQKNATNYNFNQALCRVYIGICRQLGDLERARLFCYSLLKEDFPDSEKLFLFITNVWSDIFVFQGAINKAMQLVVRQSASNEMVACLSAYLNWEQSSSLDAGVMVSNLLSEMQSCPKVEFQLSEQYGEDLSDNAWQYIFAIDLLCSHLKWHWTHDNVICKVLWPSMDKWTKKRKGHETALSIPDSVIALTLRLIGRLGQIGLKEGYLAEVKNISSVIGVFVQHAKEEGVPWGVQLAAIYSLFDLASSNPEGIVEAIHAWRATVLNNFPVAVTNGIAEITSLCKMMLN